MKDCFYDYTVVNSQPSLEALENLIQEFSWTFGLTETIDDMFFYGVFFKPQNYANFKFNEEVNIRTLSFNFLKVSFET